MQRWIAPRSAWHWLRTALWLSLGLVMSMAAPSRCLAAETRIALLIGNSDYASARLKLSNPANDAAAMQRALRAAGFETIVKLNATRRDFYHAVDDFSAKIGRDPHAVGLFYYAGHGVQADGINYLIPVDAEIDSQADLEANAFDAGRVLHAMKAAQNDMNIVILDACRDNPLPKTRGVDRGLARMEAPSGTFIAYAAAPGQTAQDGASGANGVFTGEIIKAMAEPGIPLEQMFKKVIVGVRADTHGAQQPWSEASIQGDFYFLPKAVGAGTQSPGAAAIGRHVDNANELEQSYWDRIKDSSDPADFKDYKTQFPSGPHLGEAGLLMRKLDHSNAALAATPATARPAPADSTEHRDSSNVEPAAAGSWSMKVPTPQGLNTCYWNIHTDGTYAAWCVGPVPLAHSGTVLVTGGKWAVHATTVNFSDSGTYQMPNPDTMLMTGKMGTGAWLRTK